jgi:hypothetical protein
MKPVFLVTALAVCIGCAREAPAPQTKLSFQRFVAVVSDLGAAPPEQRAAILKKHNTSDAEIHAFVNAYSRDPQRLAEALDSVEHRMEVRRTATTP